MGKKSRPDDSRQMSLDDWYVLPAPVQPTPGSLNYAAELCAALSQALKEADASRAIVAARMSDLTGEIVTEPMLNAWTAKSHERHRFPLEFAAAFEVATDTTALQQLLASKRGAMVLVGDEALDAQLGMVRRKQADLRDRERIIMRQLGRSGRR